MTSQTEQQQDPKWRRLPEERPGQILVAAMDVFAEHGIAGARLEEIASRAGVSKGTIYLYFQSKEDLFRAVVREIVVPRMVETEQAVRGATPTAELEDYMRLQWERFTSTPGGAGWVRLVLTELHKHRDLAEFYLAEIAAANRGLYGILDRGMASGEFRRMPAQAAVSVIKSIALMHVLWTQFPAPAGAAPKTRATIDDMVDFVMHALRPDSPATNGSSTVPATNP